MLTFEEIEECEKGESGLDDGRTAVTAQWLHNFAQEVAKKEREACAVIAETPVAGEQDDITMEAKDRVARAIRARSNAEVRGD